MRAIRFTVAVASVILAGHLGGCRSGAPANAPPSGVRPPRFQAKVDEKLIPRGLFFARPEHSAVRVSPDGKRIGFCGSRGADGAIWVGPADDIAQAKPIRMAGAGQLEGWSFTFASDYVVIVMDAEGTEQKHVYAVDLETEKTTDLTPSGTVSVSGVSFSKRRPYEIALKAARAPGGEVVDVWTADMRTGGATRVLENEEGFLDFDLDGDFRVRVATRMMLSGEKEVRALRADGSSTLLFRVGLEDQLTTSTDGVDATGTTLYAIDSRGRNTSALVAIDIATTTSRVLAEDEHADVVEVLHDDEGRPQAVAVDPGKREWHALDPEIGRDLAAISDERHVFEVASRSSDWKTWIVLESAPDESAVWSMYDRTTKQKYELFSHEKPPLSGRVLSPVQTLHVRARDGLDLVGYLTLPPSVTTVLPPAPLPMVLFVHGGPWDRDRWEFSSFNQLLASRGYAVLAVNYRGSTGFGKKLLNAGDREWGGKMQDDLVDAVAWATDRKIADPARIAIVGASYGGYAALMGLSRDHGTFACGVDIEGPSNLVTFAERAPPQWRSTHGLLRARMGDWSTDGGRQDLFARSPLGRAAAIDQPLLIVHGRNDPLVNERESAQMAEAVRRAGGPVTYLLYPNEGHGFDDPQNWRSLEAVMEVFLSQCIGGVYEPLGTALEGSTIGAVLGGEYIPGLAAAALR